MAALLTQLLSNNNQIFINSIVRKTSIVPFRNYANKKYKQKRTKVEVPACRTLKSTEDSVAAKGFLRCQKSYTPPKELKARLQDIYEKTVGIPADSGEEILDPNLRYSLFVTCNVEFNHGVPNSILHTIKTFDDLLTYYGTPVDTTLPLEKMKNLDMPPNLHILYEPLRFLPDEDTMFNGQTAFPKSNTMVSGLRAKKKYKGHKVTEFWDVY